MSLVVYLDLDRTLYNTDLGTELIWQQIASRYEFVNQEIERSRLGEFYLYDGGQYAYDLRAHLLDLRLQSDEVYAMLRSSDLADGRLEYDGVGELIEWLSQCGEVRVLTYGTEDYQQLKASLCPSLTGVEIITTLGSKGDYLADKGEVWLVDDKPLGGELPANVRFIQVLLEGQGDEVGDWPKATRLAEVIDMFKSAT